VLVFEFLVLDDKRGGLCYGEVRGGRSSGVNVLRSVGYQGMPVAAIFDASKHARCCDLSPSSL